MRVLVDTNILLRSVQPNHPLSSQATQRSRKQNSKRDSSGKTARWRRGGAPNGAHDSLLLSPALTLRLRSGQARWAKLCRASGGSTKKEDECMVFPTKSGRKKPRKIRHYAGGAGAGLPAKS